MLWRFYTVCMVAVLCFAACNRTSNTEAKLIGKWENTLPDTNMAMVLRPDHVLEWQSTNTTPPTVDQGTWRVEGDRLILIPSLALRKPSTPYFADTIVRLSPDELEVRTVGETALLFRRVK
jgi:hypothetical protein